MRKRAAYMVTRGQQGNVCRFMLRTHALGIAFCAGVLLILSMCFSGPLAARTRETANRQCTSADVADSQVLPSAKFDVSLPPFGNVCFIARYRQLPDDPDHSKVIAFELWRNGALAYRLPKPDDGLWPPACNSILAVAFPRRGTFRDIVVIGNCEGASSEQAQPLVYRAESAGFVLDTRLSTDLMGVGTLREVEQRMRKATPWTRP